MQKPSDIAKNLLNLYEANSYKEFNKGYFVNQPQMQGYFYIFKDVRDPKLCVILNTSDNIQYPTQRTQIKDYVYIIFNIKSLEAYVDNFTEGYLPYILQTIKEVTDDKDTRNLPYGYYYDEHGDLKIDIKKANEVKKIYDMYQDTESVRQIAAALRTNFSHIRDILHNNEEYMQMKEKILPTTVLKKINELLAKNVKGLFKKETTVDRIKAIQSRIRSKKLIRKKQEEATDGSSK